MSRNLITLRVTEAERQAIQLAALDRNMSMSNFIRDALAQQGVPLDKLQQDERTDLQETNMNANYTNSNDVLAAYVAGNRSFENASLSGADFSNADLYDANFRYADLSGADFSNADLSGAMMFGANLSGANLSGATLEGANLLGANLRNANLEGANLQYTNLRNANLFNANLRESNLSCVDPDTEELSTFLSDYGANPTPARTHLNGANLRNADLTNADITGADLTGADYRDAILSGIKQ